MARRRTVSAPPSDAKAGTGDANALAISLDSDVVRLPWNTEDKDFTIAIDIENAGQLFSDDWESIQTELMEKESRGSLHRDVEIRVAGNQVNNGRAAVCFASCKNKQYLSITLRLKEKLNFIRMEAEGKLPKDERALRQASELKKIAKLRKQSETDKICSGQSKFLFPIDAVASVLFEKLNLPQDAVQPPVHGLIVFAGATKCLKTELSKGVALKYLLRAHPAVDPANPRCCQCRHLVTFEDPIEEWIFYSEPAGNADKFELKPLEAHECGLWYTSRAPGRDVASLAVAVNDALRQTPACMFIGEIRDDLDWKQALKLAGTGHLVVTTTHSGTLSETFTRIFRAVEATDEASRAIVANSLQGIVHLKVGTIDEKEGVFPAVWRKTTQSVASLISDGIASIIPDGENVLGRWTITKSVLEEMKGLSSKPAMGEKHSPLFYEKQILAWAGAEDVFEP